MSNKEATSKKPANTAFKQQRLKAWQPILTPKTVLPTFFIVAIIFIPVGIVLYTISRGVNELVIDYTNCADATGDNVPSGADSWSYEPYVWKLNDNKEYNTNQCVINFTITEDFSGPVFLYYRLTNFYQNHRRYVKSASAEQLTGSAPKSLSTDCSPIDKNENDTIIYPCGLISNSLFNDSFSALVGVPGSSSISEYQWSSQDISWPSDRKKYSPNGYEKESIPIVPPPQWTIYNNTLLEGTWAGKTVIDPSKDEHFQVWMRTAGLPNFRKLWGRNDADLPLGSYSIRIIDEYQVTSFDGTKSIVISTSSFLGGRNPFLGIAYITVGAVCLLLGIVFLVRHLISPRKLGDHSYLSWNREK